MTRRAWAALAVLCALSGLGAWGQSSYLTITTATANEISDPSGNGITGKFCAYATDQNDNPLAFTVASTYQAMKATTCVGVTAGQFTATYRLANPAATNPAGIYYHVTVTNTSTNQSTQYPKVLITVPNTQTSWDWSSFVPNTGPATLPVVTVTGPQGPVGAAGAGFITGLASDGASGIAVTGASRSAGVVDNARGLPQFAPSLTAGLNGALGNCAKMAQLNFLDDTAAFVGALYADSSTAAGATVVCDPNPFFNPADQTPAPNIPENASRRSTLATGAKYLLPGTLAIPMLTTLQGPTDFQGNGHQGTFLEPNIANTGAVLTITSYAVAANIVTLGYTGTQPTTDELGTFSGLSTATFLNGQTLKVLSAGLTSSHFEVAITASNAGTTVDSGTFTPWLYALSAWQAAGGSPLVSLGLLPSATGAVFSLASSLKNVGIDCLSVPTMTGALNAFTQQFGDIEGNTFVNCSTGVGATSIAGGGGSQNRGVISRNNIQLFGASGTPVVSHFILTAGGSGYTSAPSLTVPGCTVPPTFGTTISGGAVTGTFPEAPSFYGSCLSPAGQTAVFSGGGGTGAAAVPVMEALAPTPGMLLSPAAGRGTLAENSIVGGANAIPPPQGIDDEAGSQYHWNLYCESATTCITLDKTNTGGVFGDVIVGGGLAPANEAGTTAFDNEAAGATSFTLLEPCTGGQDILIDRGFNGGVVPVMAAGFQIGGNGGCADFYSRTPGGGILTNVDGIDSNIALAVSAYNCGTCTAANFPRPFYPLKNVGGFLQTMTAADTSAPWGIGSNGSPNTAAAQSNTKHFSVGLIGLHSVYWDNTPVPGDLATVSATDAQPARLHDTGFTASSPPTSAMWTEGYVAYDASAGSDAGLTTPNVSGVTATPSAPSTVDVQYKMVARTYVDQTTSAASAAIDVTNGPQSIGATSKITLASLPTTSTSQAAMYRTSHTQVLPTVAAHCNSTTGTFDYLTITGSQSGIWFPPTAIFSGGGGTNPQATFEVKTGQITGWTFSNYGASCTGNATAALTASTCDIGFLKFTNGSTSFSDNGICAQPDQSGSTTPPASALIGARIVVEKQNWAGTGAGTGNVTGTGGSTVGHPACLSNTSTTGIVDCGSPLSAAPVTSVLGGDLVCAHAADNTIASNAITAGTSTTLTGTSLPAAFKIPGALVGVVGASPGGLNGGPYTVLSASGNVITFTASLPATWTSGGTLFLYCLNQASDATAVTYMTNNTFNVSALTAAQAVAQGFLMSYWSTSTAPSIFWNWKIGSNTLYTNVGSTPPAAGAANKAAEVDWALGALTPTLAQPSLRSVAFGTAVVGFSSSVGSPVAIAGSGLLETGLSYAGSGLGGTLALTYSSGSSACTNGTQAVTAFNGAGSAGTGTITVSGGVPTGAVTFTNTGFGYTSIPTTATVATCTGTATFTSSGALGGAQGNAVLGVFLKTAQ